MRIKCIIQQYSDKVLSHAADSCTSFFCVYALHVVFRLYLTPYIRTIGIVSNVADFRTVKLWRNAIYHYIEYLHSYRSLFNCFYRIAYKLCLYHYHNSFTLLHRRESPDHSFLPISLLSNYLRVFGVLFLCSYVPTVLSFIAYCHLFLLM